MERTTGRKFEQAGKFVGATLGKAFVYFERGQAGNFDIKAFGLENLYGVQGDSYIIAANHLQPESPIRKILGGAPDSFAIEKVVNRPNIPKLKSVANGDFMGWVYQDQWPQKYREQAHGVQRTVERFLAGFLEGTGDVITAKLNPGSVNVEFLKKIESAIENGHPILMFVEGTWYPDWEAQHDLKDGAAFIAQKFNLPIIPAYIRGANSWEPGTEVDIAFGKQIDPNNKTRAEITGQIRQEITQLQQSLPPHTSL